MKKYNFYFKNFGLFIGLEIFIVFICSLLNLLGINTSITTIILLVLNALIFIIFGFNHGIRGKKKGFITGITTGVLLITLLVLINILFFKSGFNINQVLYYLILILSSTLGGMFGKAKKKEDTTEK